MTNHYSAHVTETIQGYVLVEQSYEVQLPCGILPTLNQLVGQDREGNEPVTTTKPHRVLYHGVKDG